MTKIVFCREADGLLSSVDIRDHAGHDDGEYDMVCAAISSAIQLTHILLEDIYGLVFDTVVEAEEGDYFPHIEIQLPCDVRKAGQPALEALLMHYTELEEQYPEFITVTEVHNDAEN